MRQIYQVPPAGAHQLTGPDGKNGEGGTGRGPYHVEASQVLVYVDRQARLVPEGGHAADAEAGGRFGGVGVGAYYFFATRFLNTQHKTLWFYVKLCARVYRALLCSNALPLVL